MEEDYKPYGKDWEKAMMKLPKSKIIGMFREAKTGAKGADVMPNGTIGEAQYYMEGCINDFVEGLSDEDEFLSQMKDYTGRLQFIFWENAKRIIREHPHLLESDYKMPENI